jgi:putative redox protein
VDVLEVLAKRRTPASSLTVRVEFLRAANPPRRLVEARLHYAVQSESSPHHIERAVQLSFDKYCSVAASLAPDTRFDWTVEVAAANGGGQISA